MQDLVAWTEDATTAAQAQSLVNAGQTAIGMSGMGRLLRLREAPPRALAQLHERLHQPRCDGLMRGPGRAWVALRPHSIVAAAVAEEISIRPVIKFNKVGALKNENVMKSSTFCDDRAFSRRTIATC